MSRDLIARETRIILSIHFRWEDRAKIDGWHSKFVIISDIIITICVCRSGWNYLVLLMTLCHIETVEWHWQLPSLPSSLSNLFGAYSCLSTVNRQSLVKHMIFHLLMRDSPVGQAYTIFSVVQWHSALRRKHTQSSGGDTNDIKQYIQYEFWKTNFNEMMKYFTCTYASSALRENKGEKEQRR